MNKSHYPWWNYIKAVIRAYPEQTGKDLSGVAKREFEAVQAAVEATERMTDGGDRTKVIRLVHWQRAYTLEGAALIVPCHKATAARWQRRFFEEVARNRGLLDGGNVEIAPVAHGRWERFKPEHYRCSCCSYSAGGMIFNYCPCCGAKMDSE